MSHHRRLHTGGKNMLKAVKLCQDLAGALDNDPAEGRVHSVFDGAVNISAGGRMVSILPDFRCLYPWSCTVNITIPFHDFRLNPGMEVGLSRSLISVPEVCFSVKLGDAELCDLSLWPTEEPAGVRPEGIRLSVLKSLLRERDGEWDMSPLVSGRKDNLYSKVVRQKLKPLHFAFAALNDAAAASAAACIAGCGIGLTPSSDDLLVGYLCAFIALSWEMGRSRETVLAVTRAAGAAAAGKTNSISGAFLLQSSNGFASEDVLKLFNIFFSGASLSQLIAAARRVLAFGSTSGTDILTGIVLSIQTHFRSENLDQA